jgi:hypothetical protein
MLQGAPDADATGPDDPDANTLAHSIRSFGCDDSPPDSPRPGMPPPQAEETGKVDFVDIVD